MNWNGNTRILSSFGVDMMTAIDSFQFPALSFNELTEFLAAYYFQTAISMTLSFPVTAMS